MLHRQEKEPSMYWLAPQLQLHFLLIVKAWTRDPAQFLTPILIYLYWNLWKHYFKPFIFKSHWGVSWINEDKSNPLTIKNLLCLLWKLWRGNVDLPHSLRCPIEEWFWQPDHKSTLVSPEPKRSNMWPFQGIRASAAYCLSNGETAVRAKRTTSLSQNFLFHAGSSNFSMMSIRMLNLHCSQPDKIPNVGMYFISEENLNFAVFTHFFIYKNINAFSYLYLSKIWYTYPPY